MLALVSPKQSSAGRAPAMKRRRYGRILGVAEDDSDNDIS